MQGTPSGGPGSSPHAAVDLVRVGVALAVGVLVGLLAWSLRPPACGPRSSRRLPELLELNYQPIIWGWRILVWLAPLTAAACYLLLGRVGPCGGRASAPVLEQQHRHRRPRPATSTTRSPTARVVAILGVPAVLVASAVSALSAAPGGAFSVTGVLAGAAYALAVAAVAWLVGPPGSSGLIHAR